jgi:hypothetical protein
MLNRYRRLSALGLERVRGAPVRKSRSEFVKCGQQQDTVHFRKPAYAAATDPKRYFQRQNHAQLLQQAGYLSLREGG